MVPRKLTWYSGPLLDSLLGTWETATLRHSLLEFFLEAGAHRKGRTPFGIDDLALFIAIFWLQPSVLALRAVNSCHWFNRDVKPLWSRLEDSQGSSTTIHCSCKGQ